MVRIILEEPFYQLPSFVWSLEKLDFNAWLLSCNYILLNFPGLWQVIAFFLWQIWTGIEIHKSQDFDNSLKEIIIIEVKKHSELWWFCHLRLRGLARSNFLCDENSVWYSCQFQGMSAVYLWNWKQIFFFPFLGPSPPPSSSLFLMNK